MICQKHKVVVACETFCLDDDDTILEATNTLQSESLTTQNVRFIESQATSPTTGLAKCHSKKVSATQLKKRTNLHGENSAKATLLLEFKSNLSYKPGDHLGVFAMNRPEIVDKIIQKLKGVTDPEVPVELQVLQETQTSNGVIRNWKPHERIPSCSVRELFSRYLDITTPPTPNLLQHFASIATNEEEQRKLNLLASDSAAYEDWRHWRFPHLLEVLEEFPSVSPYAPLLVAQLSILQPRFYSISSICSNYLQDVPIRDDVYVFVRSAPSFYLPNDSTKPVILVGPGTGIAPFRAFWSHRYVQLKQKQKLGKMWLFFGCRTNDMDLYKEEKANMERAGVLDRVFLALSREPNVPKTYVQDLASKEGAEIYRLIVMEKGHFYVCGDCTMADNVYQTLKSIIQKYGGMNDSQVQSYMMSLRDENRYHEDIFGITLRTAEVHNRSRESARIRMATQP
nr:unnamed protein product [Callosobruchus chinensis]